MIKVFSSATGSEKLIVFRSTKWSQLTLSTPKHSFFNIQNSITIWAVENAQGKRARRMETREGGVRGEGMNALLYNNCIGPRKAWWVKESKKERENMNLFLEWFKVKLSEIRQGGVGGVFLIEIYYVGFCPHTWVHNNDHWCI